MKFSPELTVTSFTSADELLSATTTLNSAVFVSPFSSKLLEYVYFKVYSPGTSHLYTHVFMEGVPTATELSDKLVSDTVCVTVVLYESSSFIFSSFSTVQVYPVLAFSSSLTANKSPALTVIVLSEALK